MLSAAEGGATADVVVVGSANRDLVSYVDALPRPGETVIASAFETQPGGKGNNQATAVARSGVSTVFIASLGESDDGDTLIEALSASGVEVIARRTRSPTGTAMITVAGDGENSIVVNPGANEELRDLSDVERRAIIDAKYLLVQLEVPLEVVSEAAEVATGADTRVVLNAAPAQTLPDELLAAVDLLIVNEHEAGILAGSPNVADPGEHARILLTRVKAVIITLGGAGALVATREAPQVHVPGRVVEVVDTTGAGDTFCGALVAALADQLGPATLEDAVRFATIAASLSVQARGAVPSIPWRTDIEAAAAF